MVVMAHRRISFQDKVDHSAEPEKAETEAAAEADVFRKVDAKKPDWQEPILLLANTENYEHEPYDITDEIKAMTQEIIKTIKDIMVSPRLYDFETH